VIVFTILAVVAVASPGTSSASTSSEQPAALTYATSTCPGTPLTTAQLLERTVLMVAYIGWSMLGVAAVSLFLSTLTDSSLGAALGGLAVLVGSTVLVTLDAAGTVRDWLPTRYWLAWVDLFRDPILWHDIQRGVLVQGFYIVVLLGAAWANFATRDVTS
jgi:ABC-2 type transport system permease protein